MREFAEFGGGLVITVKMLFWHAGRAQPKLTAANHFQFWPNGTSPAVKTSVIIVANFGPTLETKTQKSFTSQCRETHSLSKHSNSVQPVRIQFLCLHLIPEASGEITLSFFIVLGNCSSFLSFRKKEEVCTLE